MYTRYAFGFKGLFGVFSSIKLSYLSYLAFILTGPRAVCPAGQDRCHFRYQRDNQPEHKNRNKNRTNLP